MSGGPLRGLVLAGSLCLTLSVGCGAEPPTRRNEKLAAGVLARVGDLAIAQVTVERIAAAQGLDGAAALDRALSDARFALAARESLPAVTQVVIERAALARALLEGIAAHARDAGPPSDGEVEELTRQRWVELDRPAAVRVTHAVALQKKPSDAAAARAIAEQLSRALAGIREPSAFIAAARAVTGNGIEIRAERLPYIAADGRGFSFEPAPAAAGHFDPRFAAAANALLHAGEQSGVVESDFGYHVILLEERLPARHVPLAERRAALTAEILSRRAERERRELVTRLRGATTVEVARDFEAVTGKLAP